MANIIKTIISKQDLFYTSGVDMQIIKDAEKNLCVRFAKDYIEYLLTFGVASFEGHEFTGICKSKRLNVVDVTKDERKHSLYADKMYVIEQTNIDGIIIWQDENGYIYQSSPNGNPICICNTLTDYIKNSKV